MFKKKLSSQKNLSLSVRRTLVPQSPGIVVTRQGESEADGALGGAGPGGDRGRGVGREAVGPEIDARGRGEGKEYGT